MFSGPYRKIDNPEAQRLAAKGLPVEWAEGIGWIVYDDQARREYLAVQKEMMNERVPKAT